MNTPSKRLRLGLSFSAVLVLVVLVAGACGGSDDSPDVASLDQGQEEGSTENDTEVDEEQALLDFTGCMREQGVDMPDPEPDEAGNLQLQFPHGAGSSEVAAFREAADACGEFLEGATQGFHGGDVSETQDAILAFARCMREEGIEDLPDPDFAAGGGPGSFFSGIDFDDPEIQAAADACQEELSLPGGQ